MPWDISLAVRPFGTAISAVKAEPPNSRRSIWATTCLSAQSRNHPIAAAYGAAQLKSNQLGSTVSPAPGQRTMQVVPTQEKLVPEEPVPQKTRSERRSKDQPVIDLDGPGYQRLDSVLRILSISRSSFYSKTKKNGGPYPDPEKLGLGAKTRAVGIKNSSIKALLELLDQHSWSSSRQ